WIARYAFATVWASTPCAASTTSSAPSHACSERETSYVKSTCPGVSMRFSSWPFQLTRTACALIVIPRSRSSSIESSTCARISRPVTVFVSSRMRSASVDLPWSMCAMIEKLRMRSRSIPRSAVLEPAPQREQRVELTNSQQTARNQVHAEARDERRSERYDLRESRAAERMVEHVPDRVGDCGERGRREGDAHERARCSPELDAAQPVAEHDQQDRRAEDVGDRGGERNAPGSDVVQRGCQRGVDREVADANCR